MTIPEGMILVLLAAGSALLIVRIRIAVRMCIAGIKNKDKKEYETGFSKTIGDRQTQEDEYGITETQEGIMAVLADGMGKNSGGRIAARIAVQVFLDLFEDGNTFYNPQYSLRKAFQGANREILNQLEEEQGTASVAAVMLRDRMLYYAAVGSVKVAVFRNHELVPLTMGHTIGMLARKKYEEGKLTKQEAVRLLDDCRLYNYVGQDGFHDIEFFDAPVRLYGGEYVVLMSDGLYETARFPDIEKCLEGEGSPQDKAYRIIELVNQSDKDGKDNASVVILKVG